MEKDMDGMRSEFHTVTGCITHVLKFGSIPQKITEKYLFFVIPGNPGIIEYYESFMRCLYHRTGSKIPVWGMSYAGHVSLGNEGSGITEIIKQPPEECTLYGQIRHKLAFIQEVIPADVKLVLIGHSIGCYMILRMLKYLPKQQIMRCFLLFPTIERMALSPRGQIITPLLQYLRWIAVFFVKAVSYFSPQMQYRLILRFFKGSKVPECALNASMNLFDPQCVNKVTYLARQEMEIVTELDHDLISNYISKLSFYYGADDHWCPKDYCYEMKKNFPHADIRLCNENFSHAFVLDASQEMSKIIWDWIQKDLHHKAD
ncbi:hypothetical protein LOTGIDRAFT_152065 [Lottia gigantea]|uniref:Lipid droplet-associated hydrolase n=1 Tax=Lottia gigantea TaxID=225164 RepID=V4AM33_LOTGI|nr:hypothetical protein LOTGIDRAFT_152065 [Lottia gigantea]ESP05249.1 hypothetical protein LOTGIDRAFT_152065 [Lottia gigantea]